MERDFLTKMIITNINLVATLYNGAGSKSKRSDRPCWAILIRYEGETEYTCYGKKYVSNKNQMVILPKGSSYEWLCTKSGHYATIEFECEESLKEIISIPVSNGDAMLKLFKELEYKRMIRSPLCELECMKGTYEVLLRLFQGSQRISPPLVKQKKIQPAVDYMIQNYNKKITNDELAAMTSLSTVYFRKLFTEIYGMSPITYVHDLRIKKAQEMLRSDYGSISELAWSLGYLNVYDFSRTFKKHTGVSPVNYLKLNKEG